MALLQKNKMTKRYEASRHVTMATESWSHTYSGFPRGNFFRKKLWCCVSIQGVRH